MNVVSVKFAGFLVLLCGIALISIPPNYAMTGVMVAALGSSLVIYSALTNAEAVELSVVRRALYAAAIPAGIVTLFLFYVALSQ
jgi:hypothetical protein